MGVICATFYVWHRRECDPQGNFKHPTEDKTYRRLSLLTNEVELIRNSKNTVRAQAFLAHELGKARSGHGTSSAPWISIVLSMSNFDKLAVPRDLKATLSLLTRSRRFIISTIIRGSYSQ